MVSVSLNFQLDLDSGNAFFTVPSLLTRARIYRAKILFALEKDLLEELEWLNGVSLKYLKNYQIWYVKLEYWVEFGVECLVGDLRDLHYLHPLSTGDICFGT